MRKIIDTKVLNMNENFIAPAFIDKAVGLLVTLSDNYYKYFTKDMNEEERILFDWKIKDYVTKDTNKRKDILFPKCQTNEYPNTWISDFSKYPVTSRVTDRFKKTQSSMMKKYKEKLKTFDFLNLYNLAYNQSEYCRVSYQLKNKYTELLNKSNTTSLIKVEKNKNDKGDYKTHFINMVNSYGDGDANVKIMNKIIDKIKKNNSEFGLVLQYEFFQITKNELHTYFPKTENNTKLYRKSSIQIQYLSREYGYVDLVFEILFQDYLNENNINLNFDIDSLYE